MIRVLVAKPGLDGHDRGARVVASALRDAGFEVIYSGLRAQVPAIAAAAVQEGVDVVGLSILSGAHESICRRLIGELRARGAEIPVVVGGIIPEADRPRLLELGVKAVFGPESPLEKLVEAVRDLATGRPVPRPELRASTGKPGEAPAALRLVGMAHVAVCVADLDEASRIFERVLGRAPAHREYVPEQKTEAVFFDLGDGTSLELVAPRGGNEGLEKFLARRGPGLHHVALKVDGIAEGIAALRAQGLQLIDQTDRKGAREHRVAFLHPKAAGGVLVELVEEHARTDAREGSRERMGETTAAAEQMQ